MIHDLPVLATVKVVPLPIVRRTTTNALLLAAIVILPVVAFVFTRNKLSLPFAFPLILPSLPI